MTRPLRFALVAGEASGDTLGAGLIEAIKAQAPDAQFVGMAGPKMIAAGCEPWYRAEEIAVMGFFEVLPHLRRILALRRELLVRAGIPAQVAHASPPRGAAADDLLDALACATIARRLHAGLAQPFPPVFERDEFGLPMAIWA